MVLGPNPIHVHLDNLGHELMIGLIESKVRLDFFIFLFL